jgi:hypothetical protein
MPADRLSKPTSPVAFDIFEKFTTSYHISTTKKQKNSVTA